MNLLLLRPEEAAQHHVRLEDRRAEHVIRVLKKGVGQTLKLGVQDKGIGKATVVECGSSHIVLELGEIKLVPAPLTNLVLALPRPKVLSRVLAAAASFGLRELRLINAWRVEKSYFASPRLEPARIEEDLRLGCEQGAQCWLPQVSVIPRFTEHLASDGPLTVGPRLVLHPQADQQLHQALCEPADGAFRPLPASEVVTLAIGPEGGFIDQELNSLEEAGYRRVALGTGPLKTDVAVAAALGQLALVRSF